MTHTKGPWTVTTLGSDALVQCSDGRTFNIGDVIYHRENIANARLVAAAPELLAACRAALDWYGLDGDHITDPTRALLLAAIAKAIVKAERL